MPELKETETNSTVVGTSEADTILGGSGDDSIDAGGGDDTIETYGGNDAVDGEGGEDSISGGTGDDLLAAGKAGEEWSYVDGKWVFNPEAVNTAADPYYKVDENDNTLIGNEGEDVLLGARGKDLMVGGEGADTINAGRGNDMGFGGDGSDLINLESGDDYGEGGKGADVINAGAGDDVVFGDSRDNLLQQDADTSAVTFEQHAESGWLVSKNADSGLSQMTQTIETTAGETYALTFDLAANLAGGSASGAVQVLWNGKVIDTIQVDGGVFESQTVEFAGTGQPGELTFVTIPPETDSEGPEINMDGPIFSYDKEVSIGGEETTVAAFAPGQAKLYQVIDGQLKVFDTQSQDYADAGGPTGFKINAVGFNVEDDLIYGIAKSDGTDALGNPIQSKDLVMMDAEGQAYKIGEAPYGDYVGDFDDSGNLWTFHTSMNRITKIDIDNLDANGQPTVVTFNLPNDLVSQRVFDIAYNAEEGAFYGVTAPKKNGDPGSVIRVDVSDMADGGEPVVTTIPITSTLFGDEMQDGMVAGAYGAVFVDGDGNLYAGLNRGDHDFDSSTSVSGAIYKINIDASEGVAYTEFMSEATTTGSNDGAADPRSMDAFAEVDGSATLLLRSPDLQATSGGDDKLRGGSGEDEIYGGGGDDIIHGGNDDDELHGDHGDDRMFGGRGDDEMHGGAGKDHLIGGAGDDDLRGGNNADFLNAGGGDDQLKGGSGDDKLVGGAGSDTIEGGAGDDNLWGGNWTGDGSSDTFVVSAGGGLDLIHDFETDHDLIDLSSYGLEFADLKTLITDQGWAAEIDLSGLEGGTDMDRLILKSIDPDDLDESNFIL
ncbi:MAG: calcium-binding protein [Rhodobacteraceae bacterium]|nr:calcium-binding protein [Paracoccaceae bacterium]